MLKIANKVFHSRLFTGTGKFGSSKLMVDAIEACGSELTTLALKRVDIHAPKDDIISPLNDLGV